MKKIKSILFYIFIGVLFLIMIGLLSLTSQGIVSLRKPYARQLTKVFQPNQGVVVFEDVNVIPMDREHILTNQTVLVWVSWHGTCHYELKEYYSEMAGRDQ